MEIFHIFDNHGSYRGSVEVGPSGGGGGFGGIVLCILIVLLGIFVAPRAVSSVFLSEDSEDRMEMLIVGASILGSGILYNFFTRNSGEDFIQRFMVTCFISSIVAICVFNIITLVTGEAGLGLFLLSLFLMPLLNIFPALIVAAVAHLICKIFYP